MLASAVPLGPQRAGVTAIHVVTRELVAALAQAGHAVVLQLIFNEHRREPALSDNERAALAALAARGIGILDPIFPRSYVREAHPRLQRLARLGLGRVRVDDLYPAARARATVCARVRAACADAVLTVWSPEGLAATHGLTEVPRIAYHGDVDFAPAEAREHDRDLFFGTRRGDDAPFVRRQVMALRRRVGLAEWRRAHHAVMREVDVIANVTASNAGVYAAQGHPRSVYVRNTWCDPGVHPGPRRPAHAPLKIVGHVGYLNRTASAYGLRFLLRDLVPALEGRRLERPWEVHMIGGGELPPALREPARHPRVRLRGYVEDLDAELSDSDMVLLLNNVGRYQAAFTRHVVSWALGLCLVVHENSVRAIPDIVPYENAFVGADAAQLAAVVHHAATHPDAVERVRKGGRATYERAFVPSAVAEALEAEIAYAIERRRTRAAIA